jgi:hypothetical protein
LTRGRNTANGFTHAATRVSGGHMGSNVRRLVLVSDSAHSSGYSPTSRVISRRCVSGSSQSARRGDARSSAYRSQGMEGLRTPVSPRRPLTRGRTLCGSPRVGTQVGRKIHTLAICEHIRRPGSKPIAKIEGSPGPRGRRLCQCTGFRSFARAPGLCLSGLPGRGHARLALSLLPAFCSD